MGRKGEASFVVVGLGAGAFGLLGAASRGTGAAVGFRACFGVGFGAGFGAGFGLVEADSIF